MARIINSGVRYGKGQGIANDQIEVVRGTIEQGYKLAVEKMRLRLADFRVMSSAEHREHPAHQRLGHRLQQMGRHT